MSSLCELLASTVIALRLTSSVAEAVIAISIAGGTIVALLAFLNDRHQGPFEGTKASIARRRVGLWLALGICIAVAAGATIFKLTQASEKRPKSAATITQPPKPTATIPTAAELAQRAAVAQRHQHQLQQQGQLKQFVREAMQQAVNCTPNEHLPPTATAQQICRFGRITVVYTRLSSVNTTRHFLKERYLNSAPFERYAGTHCGDGPFNLDGSWHNGNDIPQGYWVFRTSGTDVVLLWEYRSQRVVIRASQNASQEVNQLCELWYRHSGETPQ